MAKNKETGLTDKQDDFCHQYIIDKNGEQAALRAKYAKKSARMQAARLLTKANIRARIDQLQAKLSEKLDLTVENLAKDFIKLRNASEEAKDRVNWNRANENLAKHIGFYEQDNKQKADGLLSGIIDVIRKGSD
jgi:phage terminase small subunit